MSSPILFFLLDPGFLIMQYEFSLYWSLAHTVMRIKVNWTSASRWCSKIVFSLQVCIFSKCSFSRLGSHLRAPEHVYMTWNKDEEVSGEKNCFFDYTYFWSGGQATEKAALYFFVNCIFQFIFWYHFLVFFLF